jgi:hypothetical protein
VPECSDFFDKFRVADEVGLPFMELPYIELPFIGGLAIWI